MRLPRVVKVQSSCEDLSVLDAPAKLIKSGGLVAFPTETVYGLGANALSEKAVSRLFEVKKRALDDPVIVHIARKEDLPEVASDIPAFAHKLAGEFWPGAITLVLKKKKHIPDLVTAGLDTVAVRMPGCLIARELIKRSGVPVAAPSANMFGRVSPTCAKDVIEELGADIDMVVDAGRTEIGVESTVCDITGRQVKVLRPGGVSVEMLRSILPGEVSVETDRALLKRSPGSARRHYSPSCALVIIERGPDQAERVLEKLFLFEEKGLKACVLASEEHAGLFPAEKTVVLGPSADASRCARGLYSSLRALDKFSCDVIIAEAIDESGLGLAVMNRLRKASG